MADGLYRSPTGSYQQHACTDSADPNNIEPAWAGANNLVRAGAGL